MNFLKLVIKEIKGSRWTILLFIALTVLWHLYLFSRIGRWEDDFYLSMAMIPFFVLPLWIIGNMFHMLHSEWNTNSIYLLLSLPIRGWKVLGSKITASLIDLGVLGLASGVSAMVFFGKSFYSLIERINPGIPITWVIQYGLILLMFYLFVVIVSLVLGQFAYLISRLVNRFKGLIVGATVFVALWLYVRLGAFLAPLFEWFPDIRLNTWYSMNNVVHTSREIINTAPLITVTLFTLIVFLVSSWLYDRHIEV